MQTMSSTRTADLAVAKEPLDLDRRMNRAMVDLMELVESGKAALASKVSLAQPESDDIAESEKRNCTTLVPAKLNQDAILMQALAIVEQSERDARKSVHKDLVASLLDRTKSGHKGETCSVDAELRSISDARFTKDTGRLEYRVHFTSWEPASELGWLAISIKFFHRRCKTSPGPLNAKSGPPIILGMQWVTETSSLGPGMVHASRLNPETSALEYKISSSIWEPASSLGKLFCNDADFIVDRMLLFHGQNPDKPRPECETLTVWLLGRD